jgi:hypothetical protein
MMPLPQAKGILKTHLEPASLKILVLSPHRDTAAFSLSLSCIAWLAARHTITIANVFSRSLQAPFSDADFAHPNDRLSYVSAMRRREDELFLQRLPGSKGTPIPTNIHLLDLNLKDAPLRLRCTDEELTTLPINLEDPAIDKIRKALVKQLESGNADALLIPLGLGNHIDHRTVREAARSAVSSQLPTAFYEDLPGAIANPDSSEPAAIEASLQFGQPLTPVFSPATPNPVETKRRLALAYPSQIDSADADLISSFATRYDGAERLWANQAWLTLAEQSRLSAPHTKT